MRLFVRNDWISQYPHFLDLTFDDVSGLEIQRFRVVAESRHPGNRPSRQHVPRGITHRRIMRNDFRYGDAHVARMRLLPRLAVYSQRHRQIVGLGYLVSRHDMRAQGTKRVDPFAKTEYAR